MTKKVAHTDFFQVQQQNPTKGDWVSECRKDLTELEIHKTFEEIRKICCKRNCIEILAEEKRIKGKRNRVFLPRDGRVSLTI